MNSSVLISNFMSFGVVWRVDQIHNKKDLNFRVGATKTGLAIVASACYMLAKSIVMHSKRKEVRSSAQTSTLSWNKSRDWIYNCRFCNIKGC